MPNLFFNLPKTLPLSGNVKILPTPTPLVTSAPSQKYVQQLLFFFFPPPFHPDGTTAVSSISKAEVFAQTFPQYSTLDDSGYVPP